MTTRQVPRISLRDFDSRKDQIGKELIAAAENIGFFILIDQERPSQQEIEEMFDLSTKYFALPDEIKAQYPFIREKNTGWEKDAQIRPSTGIADPKESLQLQYFRRDSYWPKDLPDIPQFHEKVEHFMESVQDLSIKILSFFAVALGKEPSFFTEAHDLNDCLSTLRLLRYHDITGKLADKPEWRAGAHTDFDVLTLLFQETDGDGLEVCPGREAHTSFAVGDDWTPVPAKTGEITVNIGDMLMAWSDDRFKSLYHRVKMPRPDGNLKARNSIAYFNQPLPQVMIQGPTRKYDAMTASEYILNAMRRYYQPTGSAPEAGERSNKLVAAAA
ncbi:Clavaminate synthase-like protein [Gymnopus androsaceus JB14]|uniref:Clavaminate synthase-like protein n=1 Tax=Gymnopus androsaceus JB14 TaxID=1447944 RepID=A0A6A4H4X8_9AGAR|nr:Clavaminate synthase-like protein [Gymnopus androsaceus JB14]